MYSGPQRKQLRLKNYNYSQNGFYFITICTKNREEFFGDISEGKMILNEYGKIVKQEILVTEIIRNGVQIDEFVIMPNHLHLIVVIKNINVGCDCIVPTNCIAPTNNIASINNIKQNKGGKNNEITNNGTMQSFPTLSRIIRGFKGTITKQIRTSYEDYNFGWQKSFFDVIIKNEDQLEKTRKYINENPHKWELDKNNLRNIK